ncbi:pyrolysin [Thermococcus sp. M36]|uniref:pyrolysin n=1 Tax=Thermococcus sp. M36 TaxID=1638261 RepID=UPI00143B637A|nr:pyrolysin [Thermococcus sp. M36]NJE05116.1 pyrolysin [Thermococcus sp. M36]
MKKILSAALSLLVLFSLMAVLGPASVSAKPLSEYNVLILKNVDAWNSPAVEDTLTDMGVPYDVMTSTELQNKTAQDLIDTYDMIIIISDQPQSFYDEIGPQMGKLEDYVKAGKVLEIHAANWGWNGGLWTTPLPRNVTIVRSYSNYDYVVANNTMLYSSYASHGYFVGLPADAEIITVQAPAGTPDYGKPSTAIYTLGNGKVFVTGLTVEYSVARGGPEWRAFYIETIGGNLAASETIQPIVGPVYPSAMSLLITYNLYYYMAYESALRRYNTAYAEAVIQGVDNVTLMRSRELNRTATLHYANVTKYGPVVGNFPRVHIFDDLRWAALYQGRALKTIEGALGR